MFLGDVFDGIGALLFSNEEVQDVVGNIDRSFEVVKSKNTLIVGIKQLNSAVVFDLDEKGNLVAREAIENKGPRNQLNKSLEGKEIVTLKVRFNSEDEAPRTGYLFTTMKAAEVVKVALRNIFRGREGRSQARDMYQSLIEGLSANCKSNSPNATIEIQSSEQVSIESHDKGFVIL